MKLEIYMKSGNVITLKGIKEYSGKFQGNRITELTLKYYPLRRPNRTVNVKSIDLSQIEAIVEINTFFRLT